jgi:hypothetical protein
MTTSSLTHPSETELLVYLLKEELKMNRFFTDLHAAGMENQSVYQLELSPLILGYLGYDLTDPVIDLYEQLLQKHTQALTPDRASIVREAALLYAELVQIKSVWLL